MATRPLTTLSWAMAVGRQLPPIYAVRYDCTAPLAQRRGWCSWRWFSSGEAEQPVEIDVCCEVAGQSIEDPVDFCFIAKSNGAGTKPGQDCTALPVVGEQAVHICAADSPVGRYRAVQSAISEAQERTAAVRAFGLADMHLIAMERRAIGHRRAGGLDQRLLPGQCRFDIEQAEA